MPVEADIAVVGAGAAGLFAAIWAGRAARAEGKRRSIIALDSAKTLGAKVLVAGGGRCNVTHYEVTEQAYAGASRNAIKKVLRAFDVAQTTRFFREEGVELKREETGKLFPTSDDARDVLDALLRAAAGAGVTLAHPWRVESIEQRGDGLFEIVRAASASEGFDLPERGSPRQPLAGARGSDEPAILARRAILATGGKALPRSGSDGHGYDIARSLGHTVTPRVFPALVPLILADGHFLRSLSGVALPATLEVRSSTGKRLVSFTNSLLLTHFGLSGPCALDISRYLTDARHDDSGASLLASFLPDESPESLDERLRALGPRTPLSFLRERMPERLARALVEHSQIDPTTTGATFSREARRALVAAALALPLPVAGDRGFTHAEVTAGGVPLSELHLDTMESRIRPGLHICGEICDVDGRIGGFNFQWAWASGYLAGRGAALGLASERV